MKLKKAIPISLFDFLQSGKFDCIKLGQTKEWILANFCSPDDFGIGNSLETAKIWRYGYIEFHFFDDTLICIYSDNLTSLSGGKTLLLDEWIFEDVSKLNLLYVLAELNKHNIDYKKKTDKYGVRLRLDSGVELTFENPDEIENLNPNEFAIGSFCLTEEIAHRWK